MATWTTTVDVTAGTTPITASDRNTYIGTASNLQWLYDNRMTKIAESVLGSAQASVTFSGIPGTYRHLLFVWQARSDTAATYTALQMQFNSDTGSNYGFVWEPLTNAATPPTPNSGGPVGSMQLGEMVAASGTANYVASGFIYVPGYTNTTFYKGVFAQDQCIPGAGAQKLHIGGGQWANTAAVTAIKLFPAAGNLVTSSVFQLYGLS